ncbi:hypothetical protein FHS16_000870 [Paenibacillus endophyticus]|uniref:Uncharacterized protein n=1 Tax=Paenibacillus endophyticus TaxID=1294268 RepID=A0A7W5G8P4_9BACL|nr:hypothetical protein [Paenibacillus endophyticus]MBB3150836.1 hypothetical protein [Paenibacillus endophyticus]
MNRYLKLVHMEIYRFRIVLLVLMGITALCQMSALIWMLKKALSDLRGEHPEAGAYFSPIPLRISFEWAMFNTQMWFIIPVLLCISVLSLYVFFIWYRDWIGRNAFIYRLLMLPTARRNIYLAKITALLLFVLSIVSFQLALLPVLELVIRLVVPAELRADSHIIDIISSNQALVELIPRQFEQFFYMYGAGAVIVAAVFTAILLERSYRRLGILYGLLYLSGCGLVVASPILLFGTNESVIYLYPTEIYLMLLLLFLLVASASVWLGMRLIAKKITV